MPQKEDIMTAYAYPAYRVYYANGDRLPLYQAADRAVAEKHRDRFVPGGVVRLEPRDETAENDAVRCGQMTPARKAEIDAMYRAEGSDR